MLNEESKQIDNPLLRGDALSNLPSPGGLFRLSDERRRDPNQSPRERRKDPARFPDDDDRASRLQPRTLSVHLVLLVTAMQCHKCVAT